MKFIKNHLKQKKSFKTKIIIFIGIIATVLRLILDYAQPMFLQANAMYDDGLIFNYAYSLYSFDWLGGFGQLTLAKAASYPLFIVLAHFSHIPINTFQILFYCFSLIVFFFSIRKIYNNKLLFLLIYIFCLFSPMTFELGVFKVIYRTGVLIASGLLVFSSAIGMYLNRNNKKEYYFWIAFLSISLSFFWFIKEDSYWVLPFIITSILILEISLYKDKLPKKELLKPLIPLVILIIVITGYKSLNFIAYGEYTITDRTGTNYKKVIEDMLEIKAKDVDHVWITKEAYKKALKNSKTLSSLEPGLTKCMYRDWGLLENGELSIDLSYWRLRYCVDEAGVYRKGGKYVNNFYYKVHNELQEAFDEGRLKKNTNLKISGQVPRINKNDKKMFKKNYFKILNNTLSYSYNVDRMDYPYSTGSDQEIYKVQKFTHSKIYDGKITKKDKKLMDYSEKIIRLYKNNAFYIIYLGIIGNIIYFIYCINKFIRKDYYEFNSFIILLGLYLTALFYYTVVILFTLRFLNFEISACGYSNPIRILFEILSIIGIYNIIYMLKINKKRKK